MAELVCLARFADKIGGTWACGGVVVWWCGGVVVWWCGGVVVWWCGGVVVCEFWWCGGVRILYMKFDFDKFVTSIQVFEIEKI